MGGNFHTPNITSIGKITVMLYTQNCCIPSWQNPKLWLPYFTLKCEDIFNVRKHLTTEVEFQYESNDPMFSEDFYNDGDLLQHNVANALF